MIGSQAVADEAKRLMGDAAKDTTVSVGGANPTLNGVMVLVLLHGKEDKPNAGKYVEISVLDDLPLDDQVKTALTEAGQKVTVQTASEEKAKHAEQTAKAAPAQAAPAQATAPAHGPTTTTHHS